MGGVRFRISALISKQISDFWFLDADFSRFQLISPLSVRDFYCCQPLDLPLLPSSLSHLPPTISSLPSLPFSSHSSSSPFTHLPPIYLPPPPSLLISISFISIPHSNHLYPHAFTFLFPSSLLPFFPSTLSTCAPSMEEIQCILDGV